MEFNFEGLEMLKWNISTDRAQIVDEKNGFIFLGIMFIPRVINKNIKNDWFFVFSSDDSKQLVTVWAKGFPRHWG